MSQYRIVEVNTKSEIRQFIKFPDKLYKDNKQYVPALHSDQMNSLTSVSTLKYCTRKMWVVKDEKNKIVGRICAMINPRYNELYNKKCVRFGWFDTINDIEVAKLLLDTAEKWGKDNGMDTIHGPLYYNTMGKQGMLVEGFENVPPFNCYYNFPYYSELVEKLGFEKECDWLQYKMAAKAEIPEKMRRIAGLLKERYNLHSASIEELKKDPAKVKEFFKAYNESFSGAVYNFVPFTDEEIDEEANSMLKYLKDEFCVIILDENEELAGFGISMPSISKGLQLAKGKLFPFGWYHMLKALKTYRYMDLLINGAVPKYQNTGVSSLFHIELSEKFRGINAKWAISNPQIETNGAAVNVWSRYENELYMRRRCYIKNIK